MFTIVQIKEVTPPPLLLTGDTLMLEFLDVSLVGPLTLPFHAKEVIKVKRVVLLKFFHEFDMEMGYAAAVLGE